MSQYKELQKRINTALVSLGQFAEHHTADAPAAKTALSGGQDAQKDIEKILNENAVFTNRNRVLMRKLEEQESALKALSRRLTALDEVQNSLAQTLSELTPSAATTQGQDGQEMLWHDLLKAEQLRLAAFKDEAAVLLAALNAALAGDDANTGANTHENRQEGDA